MSEENIEHIIFNKLVNDEEYARAVLPYLEMEYWTDRTNRVVYELISEYFEEYNHCPSVEALRIELDTLDIDQDTFTEAKEIIDDLKHNRQIDISWLLNKTEKFCQDRSIYNAIMESIQILDEKTDKDKGCLPQLLQDAIAVSFDTHVGHDFLDDYESRYKYYHKKENKIAFHVAMLNRITGGGLAKKTLTIWLAGTGVGKTLLMCDCAAANLLDGKNVLYITLEMAEEKIAERIDANLMNIDISQIKHLPPDSYAKKLKKLQEKTSGKLIIKEYPTATVNANHFRHLLTELKMKRNFVPDIIYIDYINLCTSSRFRNGANVGSYQYVKSIAEEIRGLAVEENVALVSATQTNREGFVSSDPGMENTSESFGLPATTDLMLAAITSEELESLNQIMIKQLKNRYNDPNKPRKFCLGVDRSKMKVYDVENSAHKNVNEDYQEDESPTPITEKDFPFSVKPGGGLTEKFNEWK